MPYTIQRSIVAPFLPLGRSWFFEWDAQVDATPWRGVGVTALLLASVALLHHWVMWAHEWILWVIALMVGAIACLSEVSHRYVCLRAEGIVRQSGLLGRKQLIVPYHEIELVKVETPGKGTSLDVGTVTIRAKDQYLRLVAIVAPYDVADLIEQQRRLAGRP